MVHIRKTGQAGPTRLTNDFSKAEPKAADEKALFQLPRESGLTESLDPIDPCSTMMKTAMRDLGVVPQNKQENKLLAHFYLVLSQYLK